jgi:uncharacterized membrane protein YuzA (DUF378 family)
MKYMHMAAFILLAIGGIAWGVYGLIELDIVYSILGGGLARVVYILIGLAAVYEVMTHRGRCKECSAQM